jgi:hypothetical protein
MHAGEADQAVAFDGVGRAPDGVEGEGQVLFLADGLDLPVDPLGAGRACPG